MHVLRKVQNRVREMRRCALQDMPEGSANRPPTGAAIIRARNAELSCGLAGLSVRRLIPALNGKRRKKCGTPCCSVLHTSSSDRPYCMSTSGTGSNRKVQKLRYSGAYPKGAPSSTKFNPHLSRSSIDIVFFCGIKKRRGGTIKAMVGEACAHRWR
jgi:hypothetical protein